MRGGNFWYLQKHYSFLNRVEAGDNDVADKNVKSNKIVVDEYIQKSKIVDDYLERHNIYIEKPSRDDIKAIDNKMPDLPPIEDEDADAICVIYNEIKWKLFNFHEDMTYNEKRNAVKGFFREIEAVDDERRNQLLDFY